MAKAKAKAADTGRLEERMWRVHQRAVKHVDRKKEGRRKACSGKVKF